MTAGHVVAAVYNVNRTKDTQKVWSWIDSHPSHQKQKRRGASGKQVIAAVAAMGSGEWEFAPGYDWSVIMGT